MIRRAQRVLYVQGDTPDQCSGISADLMHVLECALEFQSPCCAVDSLVSMIRQDQGGCVPCFEVLGDLSWLLSSAVLEAAAPSDLKPMRLYGVQAACEQLVKIFSEYAFCYGWTLHWKASHRSHLVNVLILLQVLNETKLMDRILRDAFEQIFVFLSNVSRIVLWNQVIAATMKRSLPTQMIEEMMSRMETQ